MKSYHRSKIRDCLVVPFSRAQHPSEYCKGSGIGHSVTQPNIHPTYCMKVLVRRQEL